MNKKRIIIVTIIIILVFILGLWISGIIPKQIAKISATNYLKKNFPKIQLEYVNIEWSSSFGGYVIRFEDKNNKMYNFIMNNKYFPISLGQGLYEFQNTYRVEYEGISNIDDFYSHSITSDYESIDSLPYNYSKEQAQKDNCFIIGAMVHNDYLYTDFMNKYNNKENAFIRVVQSTTEGDIYIIDILYEANNDKIHVVKDNTRDGFLAQEDRKIEYTTYEKIGVWNYQNSQYWVAYDGELPDTTKLEGSINSDELFIITTIS